jgi:hypothetical protein
MAEWTTCPACHLHHSQRPDGLCPRCKQPVHAGAEVAPAVEAPPVAAFSPIPSPATSSAAGLGRLAQSARGGQLKNARGILLFVGILSALVNGFFYASAESDVQEAIDKEIQKLPAGMVADQAKVQKIKDEAVRATHLINGGGLLLGLVFIGCGVLVNRHPVPATVTGLVLYLGGNAVFGMLNPASLTTGLIVKVLVVLGLFRAVQAAIAYQRELAPADGT